MLRLCVAVLVVCWVHVSGLGCEAYAGDGPPRRVVSMNVCTDQLAMLIAGDGQLQSVSNLASDPFGSVMATEAKRYARNYGQAEEIFLSQPDLVLTGTYTARTSVAMLKRLGVRIEQFEPTFTFGEIRTQIRHMGVLLHREARAEQLIMDLDKDLAGIAIPETAKRPLAALHYLNNYTSGSGTLAHEVVRLAGFRNLGEELGLVGTVHLPLEMLVLSAPDIIIAEAKSDDPPTMAYDSFDHPVLRSVTGGRHFVSIPDKYWVCGTPFTTEAVRLLARAADELQRVKP